MHQSFCVDTPKKNGVAERKNRHLLEVVGSCQITHLFNKSSQISLELSYFNHHLFDQQDAYQGFKISNSTWFFQHVFSYFTDFNEFIFENFCCTTFIHVHNHNRGKFDPRASKCIFVGYSSTQKGLLNIMYLQYIIFPC